MNKFDAKDTEGHARENVMCLYSNSDPEGWLGTHNNEASKLSEVSDASWTVCWKSNVFGWGHDLGGENTVVLRYKNNIEFCPWRFSLTSNPPPHQAFHKRSQHSKHTYQRRIQPPKISIHYRLQWLYKSWDHRGMWSLLLLTTPKSLIMGRWGGLPVHSQLWYSPQESHGPWACWQSLPL